MAEKAFASKTTEMKKEISASHMQKAEHSPPAGSPVERILFLQRTIGNQAVQRLIKSGALQAKLRLGAPGDTYEQEADRVAEQVRRVPELQAVSSGTPYIQRACPKCNEEEPKRQPIKEEEEEKLQKKPVEEEEEKVQAKAASGSTPEVNPDIESHIQSIKGTGQPLSAPERAFFEPRFGVDFGSVRVHNDMRAAYVAQSVNARAFALGHDVVFGAGEYAPATSKGRRLVAHELTHVVQQGNATLKGKAPTIQRRDGNNLIQRAVTETKQDSHAGLFELSTHAPLGGPSFQPQAQYSVKIEFNPYQVVDCEEIDFTQTATSRFNGVSIGGSAAKRARSLTAAEGTEGMGIDQLSGNKYPYYTRDAAGNVETGTASGRRTGSGGGEKIDKAFLTDNPGIQGPPSGSRSAGDTLMQDFQSCAICKKGVQAGVYYGCVSWGFDIDAADKFTEHPFNLISKGTPSTDFLAAAKKWNDQTVPVATDDLPLPTHITKQTSMTEAELKAEIETLKNTLKGLAAGHVNIPQITFEIKVYQDILDAMAYNKKQGYSDRDIKAIQAVVDSTPNGTYDFNTITKIKKWQVEQGLRGDGRFGTTSKNKFDAIVNAAVTANKGKSFTVDQIKKIQQKVGSKDDGKWGPNTVMNLMVWQKINSLAPTGVFDIVTQILMFVSGGF